MNYYTIIDIMLCDIRFVIAGGDGVSSRSWRGVGDREPRVSRFLDNHDSLFMYSTS